MVYHVLRVYLGFPANIESQTPLSLHVPGLDGTRWKHLRTPRALLLGIPNKAFPR